MPIRAEQRGMLPGVDQLSRLAQSSARSDAAALSVDLRRSVKFLQHVLLPFTAAEAEVVYPALARGVEGASALQAVRREDRELRRLVHEVADIADRLNEDPATPRRAQLERLLRRLHDVALLRLELDDEVLTPLIEDSLSARELPELVDGLTRSIAWHRAGLT